MTTIVWNGLSGQGYSYSIQDIDWVPAADQDGNYIFARSVHNGWEAVYVGEGDLQSRRAAHLNDGCVTRKGATHYHYHLNQNEEARLAEETDVLKGNLEAYEPVGCNAQP
jgi:hypothetical protein